MTTAHGSLKSLISRRFALLAEIANLGEFRPGSLVEHYTRREARMPMHSARRRRARSCLAPDSKGN